MLAGAWFLGTTRASPPVVHVTTQPIASAPSVTVMPAPVSLNLPAAPSPPPSSDPPSEPEPPPPSQGEPPRARAPMLDVDCLLWLGKDHPAPPRCAWDDGFPAISGDGSRVAVLATEARTNADVVERRVKLFDAGTSKLVEDLVLLTAEESQPFVYMSPSDTTEQAQQRREIQARVTRRITALHERLEGGAYRPLVHLGRQASNPDGSSDTAPAATRTTTYADIDLPHVQIVDPTTSTVVWRGRFGVPSPYPAPADPELELCSAWWPWEMAVWWDPSTRTALAEMWYRTGSSCMCSDDPAFQVLRLP